MPVSYPLNADWFARLGISSMSLDPQESVISDMTGRGEALSTDVAPVLWRGEVSLGRLQPEEAAQAQAFFDLIRRAGALFWAYDIRRPTPYLDPGGVMLGTSTPIIAALPPGNREIALAGLPAGYALVQGDYLAFGYGGGQRALHRVAEPLVVADSSGLTPAFELTTLIEPGATLGSAVGLRRAAIPCMRVPGSMSSGSTQSTITEGMSFQFVQTLAVLA